jgi:hypothetical protein
MKPVAQNGNEMYQRGASSLLEGAAMAPGIAIDMNCNGIAICDENDSRACKHHSI